MFQILKAFKFGHVISNFSRVPLIKKTSQFYFSNENSLPNLNLDYEENIRKLSEIGKIIFPNIQQYPLKRQKQIFLTYAPYKIMDPIAYTLIEKNLIKSFTISDLAEIVRFLKCLSMAKNLSVSESTFLLIEQKIIKNLHSLTNEQFLSILESYDLLALKKNNRIYRSLLGFYSNKFQTMHLLTSLKGAVFLIRSKQCHINLMIGVLDRVFSNIIKNLEAITLNQMTMVYFLFFSDFIPKKLLDKQSIENNNKFQIKENINRILMTGVSFTPKAENVENNDSILLNPKTNYEKNQKNIELKLGNLLSSEKNKLNLNDMFIFLDSYTYLDKNIPEKLEEALEKFVHEDFKNLTPNEVFKFIEITHEKNLKTKKNFKEILLAELKNYVQKYENDFSADELINLWKMVDFYSLQKDFCNKIKEKLHDKIKFLTIDQLLSLFFLSLKEVQKHNNSDFKDFLDQEILPSMKMILSHQAIQHKTIFSLMRYLINYNSEYVLNEFLPFYINLLKEKNLYQKPEDVVYALNFVEEWSKKSANLEEIATNVKLFLLVNFIEQKKETIKNLESKN